MASSRPTDSRLLAAASRVAAASTSRGVADALALTRVPLPMRVTRKPSLSSDLYAFATVPGATPRSLANWRTDGSRWSAARIPVVMSPRI